MLKSTFQSDHLSTLINERSLHLLPLGTTHYSDNSSSFIDLAVVDNPSKVLSFSKSSAPVAAGHLAFNLEYALPVKEVCRKSIIYRDFNNCDFEGLSKFIVGRLPDMSVLEGNLSQASFLDLISSFNSTITQGLDSFAALKTRTITRSPAPWMTPELRILCKERDAIYKRARRTGSRELLVSYRSRRQQIKSSILLARQSYLRDKIASSADSSQIWRLLRNEGLTSEKNTQTVCNFKADELNSYYASVASAHPLCSQQCVNLLVSTISTEDDSLFSIREISPRDILTAAQSLGAKSKGQSPDGLPFKALDKLLVSLAPFLALLFNQSIRLCCYPAIWKRAFIIPLNKCIDPKSVSDTRPIANLCHVAKIFDKIVANQILCYLEDNCLLSPYQFGFRPHHSTQTAILHLTDRIRDGIENNLVTLLLCFDFRRAFDTISHEALLLCLKSLSFSADAIKWVHSYISGREQAVIANNTDVSKFLPVTSGVPQGSSPGPVLFLALINFLPGFLKFCKFSYVLFADDLQLFIQCPANVLRLAINNMSEDALQVSSWAECHGLQLNASKTKAMIFGSPQNLAYLASQNVPRVIVGGQQIEYVTKIKSLGVVLSSDLTWNDHIASVSSKVHGALYKLRQRAWLLSRETKLLLVQALVIPYIDYACLVYDSLPGYLNLKVQRLMNAGIRFIFNLRRDASITPHRKQLNWLNAQNRRKYFLGCVVYRILCAQRPVYAHELLSKAFVNLRRSARLNSTSILIPNCATTAYQRSFHVTALQLWSELPESVTESPSIRVFCDRLHEHLFATEI